MTDIIIIRSNSIIYDSHLLNIARSLDKKYSIIVLGWNRQKISFEDLDKDDINIKLFKLNAPYGRLSMLEYFPMLVYFPIFWIWIFFNLTILKPKIIHACDLETVLPCFLYKLLFRKRLIFDVHDRYAMAFIPTRFKNIYALTNYFEELLAQKADLLVTVSEDCLNTFSKLPKNFAIIMNVPNDLTINKKRDKKNIIKISFTGHVRRGRALEILPKLISDIDGAELVVAGEVRDKELLNQILKIQNVKYAGLLSPQDALNLEANSDIIIALYDPSVTINNYAKPNKLFESMLCGVPIITNISNNMVNEISNGIIVEYDNKKQIRDAIVRLMNDPDLRRTLGNNGRDAFLKKYNWTLMEQKLFDAYKFLLNK